MKILACSYRYSGCSYHRIQLPLLTMEGIDAKVTNKIDALEDDEYDIFFFNRVNNIYDGQLDEARKKYNCKVIVDIDDSWNLPYQHMLYETYQREIARRITRNIEQADIVFASTNKLAELVFEYNKNVIVVPNAIPFGIGQFNEDKEQSDKIRIFWCGGSTHEKDIELLKNPIKRLKPHSNDIKMVLGGVHTSNEYEQYIWNNMLNYFTDNQSLPFEVFGGLPTDQYMELYNHADIGLIPLEKGMWQSYKSNLKILEFATKKIPVIVSNVEPYNIDKDAPVLWVNNQSDWYKHIKHLIYNEEKRKQLGQQLYDWAKSKYDIKQSNEIRKTAFESIATTQVHI